MRVLKWLTINSKGACRITKGKPSLDWDEIAIRLEVDLPDALFNRPRLEASITIPEEAAKGEIIQSVVADNVKEAIEQATGLTFSVAVVDNS